MCIASAGLADDPTELYVLSDREITVFRLIGQGLKKDDIARELSQPPPPRTPSRLTGSSSRRSLA